MGTRTPGAASRSRVRRIQLASRARSAGPACFRMSSGRATASSTKVSTGGRQPATMTRNRIGTAWRSCYRPRDASSARPRHRHARPERLEAPIRRIPGGYRRRGRGDRRRHPEEPLRAGWRGTGRPARVSPSDRASSTVRERLRRRLEKSRLLAPGFREVADPHRCAFLDAGEHVSGSDTDGVHLDRAAHAVLGKAVAAAVTTIGRATLTPWLGGRSSLRIAGCASSSRRRCASLPSSAWRRARRSRLLHLAPVLFEQGARPHAPRDLYAAYVGQCDVFVGIYWQSYGWIAPRRRRSRASRTSTSSRRASRCCCTSRSPRSTARSA